MAGFLIGILYANLVSRQYMTSSGIFSEYFLSEYSSIEVIAEEYMAYILRVRLVPLAALVLLGQTKLRKAVVPSCMTWSGFSCGILIVTAIVRLGMKGILLCVIGITPQFLFYALAYIVILLYFYNAPVSRWNYAKTVFVILTLSAGIAMEVYVNPVLMKMFVRTLS